jgi:hypothetical protein
MKHTAMTLLLYISMIMNQKVVEQWANLEILMDMKQIRAIPIA